MLGRGKFRHSRGLECRFSEYSCFVLTITQWVFERQGKKGGAIKVGFLARLLDCAEI
jgi:hypothetical protein